MKTVRKTLLAAAVASALTPAAALADTTLFGNVDIAAEYGNNVNFTNNNATRIRLYDPELGVKGNIDLDNGMTAGYYLRWNIALDNEVTAGNGALTADEAYASLNSDYGTVRIGLQNTGTFHAVQQADIFANTIADISGTLAADNAPSNNTINYLNGDENFSYSAAIIIADEVENDTFAADIMASMKISDNGRLNLAYFDTERSAGNQFTAALQIAGFNGVLEYQPDRYGDDANINLTLGYSLPVSDSMTFNAQLGMNDVGDNSDDDQTPMRYTLGVDQQLAKNVTAYALLDVDSLDNDAANEEETTVAAGIKVNF